VSLEVQPAPRWAVYVTWVLSLIGLGLAINLTIAHFTTPAILACSDRGLINCAAVTTSPQSYIFHVPVSVLGTVNFTALVALNSPWLWRSSVRAVHVARLALVGVGMAMVLWLLYAELLIIDHICLYCTGVHVITFTLFVILMIVTPKMLGWGYETTDEA
jgi:uncharacterized membrane protein